MKGRAIGVKLENAFRVIFCAGAGFVIAGVLFGAAYGYSGLVLAPLAAAALALMIALYRLICRHESFFAKNLKFIVPACAVLLFAVQVSLCGVLRFDPIFDLEAVFRGAEHWLSTGSFADYRSSTCHTDYFYIFPNNLGTLRIFYLLFGAARFFGITDFFATAAVFNSLLCALTLIAAAYCASRLWSPSAGVFCALLFLISAPFWFMGPVFYTDSLSMPFPVFALAALIAARNVPKSSRRILLFFAAGLAAAVGMIIKPTVWIVIIAAVIVLFLRRYRRYAATLLAVSVCLLLAVQAVLNLSIYGKHLDREKARDENMPATYWLALGLGGDGRYRSEVYSAARSAPTAEAKREAMWQYIADEVRGEGALGLINLFGNKLCIIFGDGTYGLSDFLDDRPADRSALHEFILYNGEHYNVYYCAATGVFAAVQILMLLCMTKRPKHPLGTIPALCVFGLALFLMFWEVSGRYMMNFVPMMFIAASGGAAAADGFLRKLTEAGRENRNMDYTKRTWATINLDNLKANVDMIGRQTDNTPVMAVVKANGYGHGSVVLARFLEKNGVGYFAVSNIDEAVELRDAGINSEILVLGHTPAGCAAVLGEKGISQTVVCAEYARELNAAAEKAGVRVKVHIKLDTGMNRVGFICREGNMPIDEIIGTLSGGSLICEGIFTHLCAADSDREFTMLQLARFNAVTAELERRGFRVGMKHCANSAGIMEYPETRMDAVRAGIVLYGLSPDPEIPVPDGYRRVMSLYSSVAMVKTVEKGETVSYGRIFRTDRRTVIATLPVGYADGYRRELSNRGRVLINGKTAPVIGRVCMDQMMIDVTDIPGVKEGDVAELFGENISTEDVARECGTISHEIVCGINRRVPRVYIYGGREIFAENYMQAETAPEISF